MNIGIIGYPQTGKKSLFALLVGSAPPHGEAMKIQRGVAEVLDPRFDRLVDIYQPKKATRARINILLPPRIEEHAVSEGDIFRDLAEVEVFCHVVRDFQDDAVYHAAGSVDAVRDIDAVNAEFILHDLIFVEKRVERLTKDLGKMKSEDASKERDLMLKLRETLEAERPLRRLPLSAEEEKMIRGYALLTRREMIVALNVSDDEVGGTSRIGELESRYREDGIHFVLLAVRLELEIAALETTNERREFMQAMGVRDTALHALTERCIDTLGLMSFFTVAPNEVRQWFVRRGASAVEAAGKIHSDLARGFIRAEVIKYDDLVSLGGEDKVKAAGKLGVKGRDYRVEDGDILYIRFNV